MNSVIYSDPFQGLGDFEIAPVALIRPWILWRLSLMWTIAWTYRVTGLW